MAKGISKSANQEAAQVKPTTPAANPESQDANTLTGEKLPEDAERKDGAVEGVDAEATSPIFANAEGPATPAEVSIGKSANEEQPSQANDDSNLSPAAAVLPEAPVAEMPQPVQAVVSNGMMSLVDRHNQPITLPERTAQFLLKKYPNRYKLNAQ